MVMADFDRSNLADIQHVVVKGVKASALAHFFLAIENPTAAKQMLGMLLTDDRLNGSELRVTSAADVAALADPPSPPSDREAARRRG